MGYSIIFGSACIGLVIITVVWFALIMTSRPKSPALLAGPAGTLIASIPILGSWMPKTFEPLWYVIQLTCMFWLMSFVLIGLALMLAFVLKTTKRDRIAAVMCGGLGLLLNAAALMAFMWYATVSPGGV